MGGSYLVTSKTKGDNLPIRDFKLDYKVCAQSE